MNDNEQHTVARCEARARDNGHTLRVWYPVDERLHASLCEICGAMGWIARSGDEERWRIGGSVLNQHCLVENDWEPASGG
jgi:hypothetical protein